MYRISSFVQTFALALLAGAISATIWVNLAPGSYYDFIEWHISDVALPDWIWLGTVTVTPFMLVADILMSLFFFFIGKELWEAMILPRGALSGERAILPLSLILGGMIGATLIWLISAALFSTAEEAAFYEGWQVILGSDTVLVYLFARRVFGPGHPALHFALLLAIGTDILALLILGVSNPQLYSLRLLWLILPLVASYAAHKFCAIRLENAITERERRAASALWPYAAAGVLSWFGVAAAGLPGALGLLPMLPAIAHSDRSFGVFAEAEALLHDPLNRLAHALIKPLVLILFIFGLIQGGIDLNAFTPTTIITAASIWLGRPLGMALTTIMILPIFALSLPRGVTFRDLSLIFITLSIGFTVPMIAIHASLPGGAMQEAARMGCAISLLVGPIVVLWAQIRPKTW